MLLSLGMYSHTMAQIPGVPIGVPVGTGVGVGVKLTSVYPLPYANLAADYRSVYLYRASEFGFSVDEKKGIFGVGWDVASAQSAPLRNFTIRFKEVDWNVMPSDPDMSGSTVVYFTPTYVEGPGLNWHEFPDAYCWDGTKNLAIEICVTNPEDDHTLNAKVAVAPPFNLDPASWHEWNNSGNSVCDDPGSGSGMLYIDRPIAYFRILPGSSTDIGAVKSVDPEEVLDSDESYPVDFKVQNLSCNTVDTLVLEYKWMNQPVVSEMVTGLSLQPGQYYTHNFTIPIFADTVGFHDFKLWVNNVEDLNHSNDTLHKLIWVKDADFTGLDYNGKEFWGAFMANYNNGPTLKQYLYVTSPNGANVTVSFPLLGWTKSFSVTSKSLYQLEIPKYIQQRLIANDSSETIKPTSYYVKGDAAITVYGMSTQYQSTDAFLSIPKRSLGYEYKVIAPEGTFLPGAAATNGLYTDAPSEFVVVASEDNTQVRIVCPQPTMKNEAGDTIRVVLNQGENFLVKGRVDYALGLSTKTYELTGSHILSDKRVAVISGAQCAMIPSQSKLGCQACDHILEQTQPLSTLGKRFITVDFEYKPGNDYLQVFNPNDVAIDVTISGALNQTFSVPGNSYTDVAFQGGIVVETSLPAQVVQMCTGGQCLPISMTDPFYTNIISESQWANVFSYATTAGFNISKHYVSVLKRSKEGRIAIDGNKLNASLFTAIPGTDYYYARLASSPGAHRITGDSLFVTYVYGFGYDDSYGYPASGALLVPVDAPEIEGFATAEPSKCFNDSTGIAWVEYSGGTAPFVINWDNGMHTDTIYNLSPGRYIVQVVDDFGKSFKDTVWVSSPDTLSFIKGITNIKCYGDSTGKIAYRFSGGTAPYEVWYNGINANPLTNLIAGSYAVEIKDGNGCVLPDTSVLIENTPLLLDGFTIMPDCKDGQNGVLSIDATGGVEPYTFYIDGVQSDSLGTLSPGNHLASVIDAVGCKTDSIFEIQNPDAIALDMIKTPVACYGDSLGSVIFEASGGRGNYTYIFEGDTSTQNTYKNLPANTYRVWVNDGYCTKAFRFLIDSIHSPQFNISTTPDRCDNNVGSAIATGMGGSGTYSYDWESGSFESNATRNNMGIGNYQLIATDGVCVDTLLYEIDNRPPPKFDYSATPETCDKNNARITIIPTNFWQGYEWFVDGQRQSTDQSEQLNSGNHTITFSDSACAVDSNIVLTFIEPFTVSDILKTAPTCNASNGNIELKIVEGDSPVSIRWVGRSETTYSLSNLSQGIYTAIINDGFCSDTVAVTLNNIDGPQITTKVFDARCNISNGEIEVIATGGTGFYTYQWLEMPGNNTSTGSNLSAGSYTILISDDNCTNSVEVEVKALPMFTVNLNTENDHCELANGKLFIVPSDVLGTLYYALNNDSFTAYADSVVLANGNYELHLKDDFCELDTVVDIGVEPLPELAYTIVDEHCSEANAQINLTGTSFNGVTNFYVNDTITSSPSSIQNLSAGSYFVAVSDGFCWDSSRVDIIDFPKPKAFVSTENDHCILSKGTLIIDSLQGFGNLNFQYNSIQYTAGDRIENVQAGWHQFTLTDSLCQTIDSAFVGNVIAPIITIDSIKNLSCGLQNGFVKLSVAGSETAYTIVWNDGSTDWQRNNLDEGSYTATIKGKYCSTDTTINITTLPVFTASIVQAHEAYCDGLKGALDVSYFNASGTVVLDINGTVYTNPSRVEFLPSGVYPYTIHDEYCSSTGTVEIGKANNISLEIGLLVADTCALQTGAVTVEITDNVGTTNFTLNGNSTSLPIQGLSKGNYTIVVTDDFCIDSASFTIIGLDPPSGTLSIDELDACGKSVGEASYTSNATDLNFVWDGSAGSSTINGLNEGPHLLIVSNQYCSDTLPFIMDAHDDFVIQSEFINDQCLLGVGEISLDATGTTGPFEVTIEAGKIPLSFTDTALTKGHYDYTISDRFGCEQTVGIDLVNENLALNDGNIWTVPGEIIVGDSVALNYWLELGWSFDFWIINGEIDSNETVSIAFERLNKMTIVELHAVHINGCKDYIRRKFSPTVDGVVYAPNAFTPNGDGENDFFFLEGENITKVEGSIYDRWGEEIIIFNNPNDKWDGMYKGTMSQIGVYNYRFKVEFSSGFRKEIFGSIRLIR